MDKDAKWCLKLDYMKFVFNFDVALYTSMTDHAISGLKNLYLDV